MTGPIVALDHVQVAAPAACEDEARRFYGGLLGLEEVAKPPLLAARGGVWFRVGAQELHVGVGDPFAPATKAHPAFRVSSVEALEQLAAVLEAGGAAVRWADPEEIPGSARFFVDDPWGNRIELVARVGSAAPNRRRTSADSGSSPLLSPHSREQQGGDARSKRRRPGWPPQASASLDRCPSR